MTVNDGANLAIKKSTPDVLPLFKTILPAVMAGPHECMGDRPPILGTFVKMGAGGGATGTTFGYPGTLVPVFLPDSLGNLAKV